MALGARSRSGQDARAPGEWHIVFVLKNEFASSIHGIAPYQIKQTAIAGYNRFEMSGDRFSMSAYAKINKHLSCAAAVISGVFLAQIGLAVLADGTANSDLNFSNNSATGWRITTGQTSDSASDKKKTEAVKPKSSRPTTTNWIPTDPNLLHWSDSAKPSDSPKPAAGMLQEQSGSGFKEQASYTPASSLLLNDQNNATTEAYKKAAQLDTDTKKLVDSKDYKQAFQLLDQATKASPDDGRLWYNKGLIAERLLKWTEAINAFDKAGSLKLSLKPKSSLKVAHLYSLLGDSKKPVDCSGTSKTMSGQTQHLNET